MPFQRKVCIQSTHYKYSMQILRFPAIFSGPAYRRKILVRFIISAALSNPLYIQYIIHAVPG